MAKTKKKNNFLLPVAIIVGVAVLIASVEIYLSGCCAMPSGSATSALTNYPPAPELSGIGGYINAGSDLTLAGLKSQKKVVLVDFWTFSCINCQRTIPYLNAWYDKYHDKGLEIVGVHSPEFQFEHDYANVQDAVGRFGIKYPVVLDNDFKTWSAFGNQYWPRDYLIDSDGKIRYDHIGEGNYDETEGQIQQLLDERAKKLGLGITIDKNMSQPAGAVYVDPSQVNTPEIYMGYMFARQNLGNSENFQPGMLHNYTIPNTGSRLQNLVYLDGLWYGNPDNVETNQKGALMALRYSARNVNIVAGGNGTLTVWLDGSMITATDSGSDVSSSTAKVGANRLYSLVLSQKYGTHDLVLKAEGDVRIYTFTFG